MNILGISAFYHDSAACLVRDGEIVAAAQEERFKFPLVHGLPFTLRYRLKPQKAYFSQAECDFSG